MVRKGSGAERRGRPRQAEVARLAGVSQTTVSLVLGGNKQGILLQESTRRRVLAAARELGYVPDPAARSLAGSSNNLLGVFSCTATFPTDVQHSYYPFLVGVEQQAAKEGFDLVLFTGSSSDGAGASSPGAMDRIRLADGCLFLGRHVPAHDLRRLVDDGFPLVHVGRQDELDGLAWVGADYVSASAEVVRRLAELGHRRIMLIREDDDAPASTDRERGFRGALDAAGLPAGPESVLRTPAAAAPGTAVTPDWLRARLADGVTAFVAEETDPGTAWRTLHAAVGRAGLSAPDDLSLALLGSPPADVAAGPVPTGFDIPRAELGATAVRLLIALLSGEPAGQQLVDCTFRPGRTAGPPRR